MSFPPTGPVTLLRTIKSYIYQEYSDDDDIQAFAEAYNTLTQDYVDYLNGANLPIYTGLEGLTLDWIAAGLYGMTRPALPSGFAKAIGPFNTYVLNQQITFNGWIRSGPVNYYATSDDTFKRILTWHFYKGDGKYFSIDWLKRRVMRFLIGTDGTAPNIDQTYQVSVSFGTGREVDIRILSGIRTVIGGALFNQMGFNSMIPFNAMFSTFDQLVPLAEAPVFKAAVEAGALELPFQFTWNVVIA